MKKFTKLLGIVLIIALVLSMGTMALAADPAPTTYTITINKDTTDKAEHTYGAFQIFKGDLDEKTEGATTTKTLSNIQWGDDITPSATLITAINTALGLTGDNALAATATAAAVAKAISDKGLGTDSAAAQALADAFNAALNSTPSQTGTIAANATSGTITGLNAGYYLIKDTKAVTGEGALTRFMLEVVSNVSVTEKASVPSITKKVKEKNDSAAESQTNPTGWQDAADYDINDAVPFQITATTASTVHDYTKYHVTIVDDQSDGLDAPEEFNIAVLGQDLILENKANETKSATVNKIRVTATVVSAGVDFQIKVTFENTDNDGKTEGFVKLGTAVDSQSIVITYTSVLNGNAEIGHTGNPNEVYLEYSNNPNSNDDNDEGETPKDKVIVFTYEIKALKVEPNGAGIDATVYNALTDAQKAEYVQIGTKYFKTKALSGAGFTLFKKDASLTEADANKDSFSEAVSKGDVVKSGDDFYVAVADEITGENTFEFKGTDAGVYKLVETTVPAGYNKCNDIDITVTATYNTDSADPKLTSLTVTPSDFAAVVTENKTDDVVTSINTDGIITGKVLNQSGAVLPSTGGIGTTIFYVVGSIMVVAAGVLLITKKRMGRE